MKYLGRFAPSPTGPLHAGSLVAALASWLDARAHGGTWLVRIEDVDSTRCKSEFAEQILQQLHACQLISDREPVYQSKRSHLYQSALDYLIANNQAYPCSCSRADLSRRLQAQGQVLARGQELVYPGYCAQGLCRPNAQQVAWRLRTQGLLHQEVGDFILQRADACFSYQLAVVVDDALQGITHVVRGADLEGNTSRQIYLQTCLQYPRLSYLHTPLVLGSNGEKLSKQNQAQALDPQNALTDLQAAAQILGLPTAMGSIPEVLFFWQKLWKQRRRFYETEIF